MLDHSLRHLLEEAINTSTKLTIVLLFASNKNLSATPAQVSLRLCRDIWSVEEALIELAEAGILAETGGVYRYRPVHSWTDSLGRLLTTYDEPLRRQEIVRVVGDLDRYAPYRHLLNSRIVPVA
jgi:hypothetical protein